MSATTLITGGAGFIGCNVADRLLREGERVLLLDDLSRPGVERNVAWLREQHGDRLWVEVADVGDPSTVRPAVRQANRVVHLAAQVAVTTSLVDPLADFDTNARGTLVLLEALRACASPPPLLFTSTNKVYGALDDVALQRASTRYEPTLESVRTQGIDESRPLDFHSPYGCSKGAADQYVRDYARSFGLPTLVFRMSCIYGPHQCGTEDQGWVAHFLMRALAGEPITIYGDGLQVRDILFVDDLVNAMLLAFRRVDTLAGSVFNIGGGPTNAISLVELLDVIAELHGERPQVSWEPWRVGDQRYYVSDTTRLRTATGWWPSVGARDGVARLHEWLAQDGAQGRRAMAARSAADVIAALDGVSPARGARA